MKIAFSDFDGTLYFHHEDIIPQINIEAVMNGEAKAISLFYVVVEMFIL